MFIACDALMLFLAPLGAKCTGLNTTPTFRTYGAVSTRELMAINISSLWDEIQVTLWVMPLHIPQAPSRD
jgi:hypothetical protein